MADNEKSERKEEKEQQQQDVELATWYTKIEMIGIDIKSLQRKRNRATDAKNNIHESAFYK